VNVNDVWIEVFQPTHGICADSYCYTRGGSSPMEGTSLVFVSAAADDLDVVPSSGQQLCLMLNDAVLSAWLLR